MRSDMDNSRHRFVADVMLGKLARWLRLLGCDVLYDNSGEDSSLLATALSENRILITHDTELARRAKSNGYLVETEGTENQLREIIRRFDIEPVLYGDRCPECNGTISEVPRESIEGEVPEYTYRTHNTFRRCENCGRIFWVGSHRELAQEDLKRILSNPVED